MRRAILSDTFFNSLGRIFQAGVNTDNVLETSNDINDLSNFFRHFNLILIEENFDRFD